MSFLKKITTTVYLLVFSIYAISPITAMISMDSPLKPMSHEEIGLARLMIFDIFLAGESAGQCATLNAQDDDGVDILLKKKSVILSTSILLEVISENILVLDRPQIDYGAAHNASKPSYYSAGHFFVSGVSPPVQS